MRAWQMQAQVDGLGAGGEVEALPACRLAKATLRLCQMAKMRRAAAHATAGPEISDRRERLRDAGVQSQSARM
jgi:hypothetical protein